MYVQNFESTSLYLISMSQTRSLPVRKDDEVHIGCGKYKGREGEVARVYREKCVIHIDRVQRDKSNGSNGASPPIGAHLSNVVITTIKLEEDRHVVCETFAVIN